MLPKIYFSLGPYAVGQVSQLPGVLASQTIGSASTKHVQQTSELRAALAQPSKLQQHEQLLQLQQAQPRGVAAPRVQPPANPVQALGQHRLPVNIHNRMTQPTRGAESKINKDVSPSLHSGGNRLPAPEGLSAHLPSTQIYSGK